MLEIFKIMNKKIILILFLILIILISLLATWVFVYKNNNFGNLIKIKYGYQNWPGVLPYLVAYEKNYFKENGLDVTLVKENSYVDEINNVVSGKTDFIGDIALIDVVKDVSEGKSLKVILATDYSNGADGIVANKSIKNVSGLNGKIIAVEEGTLGEFLLFDALKKNKLVFSDVKTVNLSAQESAKAFINKKVDACVTYEPDLSEAILKGDGVAIFTSANSPGLIIDALVFRPEFVDKNYSQVQAVVKAYFKALDFIEKNQDKAYEIGSKYFEVSAKEFETQYKGIKQVPYNENVSLMTYGDSNTSLHGLINNAYSFLYLKGTVNKPIDSTDIIDPRFIRSLSK